MHQQPIARRVITVVLDGLRPDAIELFDLTHVRLLVARSASTLDATTVVPSLTVAAMTSLMTGVSPATHGLMSDRVFIPRPKPGIIALPEYLSRVAIPSRAFMGGVPAIFRGVANRIARRLGLTALHLVGDNAAEILDEARITLTTQQRGLVVLHWPDADRAGHDHGWMSPAYAEGCRRLDASLGSLMSIVEHDPSTLLIALADHGGGGRTPRDHESNHPLDCTIPLMLHGENVVPGQLGRCGLIDVPPTILFALGLDVPKCFDGRVLSEAFERQYAPAAAVA